MDNIRITYLRDQNRNAFGCLAVKLDRKKNEIHYAISVCHSKSDVYNQTHGYNKAVGRVESTPFIVEYVRLEGMSAHEITRHVMHDILVRRTVLGADQFGIFTVQEGLPTRVRRIAKAWLKKYNDQTPITVRAEEQAPDNKAAMARGFEAITNALESRPTLPSVRAVS